jgi:VIT1/CCC1 family predicted Fe2+/Mn2+ transporter
MGNSLDNWSEEKQSSYLYKIIASKETSPKFKEMFLQLAEAAEEQSEIWAKLISKAGKVLPSYKPDFRTRVVGRLIRLFGPQKIKAILAAMKIRGLSVYSVTPPLEEHPFPKNISEIGLKHRSTGALGNLRAAVFGINDGLLSNTSLILGVAGAEAQHPILVVAGIAGLLAGSFSMAAGEYISVKSQKEMFEYQIGLEREELKQYPEAEAAELTLIYKNRGLSKEEAEKLAKKMIADPERGLDTLAREELGINPEDLVSPWGAALSSFLSFAVGAFIPLAPFVFSSHLLDLRPTLIATGLSLFGVGALLSLFTGRNSLWSGIRMVLIGGGAGLLTYFAGSLLSNLKF